MNKMSAIISILGIASIVCFSIFFLFAFQVDKASMAAKREFDKLYPATNPATLDLYESLKFRQKLHEFAVTSHQFTGTYRDVRIQLEEFERDGERISQSMNRMIERYPDIDLLYYAREEYMRSAGKPAFELSFKAACIAMAFFVASFSLYALTAKGEAPQL